MDDTESVLLVDAWVATNNEPVAQEFNNHCGSNCDSCAKFYN